MNNWYVIRTKSRAEKRVCIALAKLNIIHFLPLQKQLRQWKDRKKWIETPLMSTYLFVNISENYKNIVFSIPGVTCFLTTNGKANVLNNHEIERIKKICAYESTVKITSNTDYIIGEEIEIIEGPLTGMKGRLMEKMSNTYLYVLIENLGFCASFKIDKRIVKYTTR